ncbi:PREDICTED: olfactory receptor 7A17-like [Odobenus rosmarus divergens]|uniref:Olfactory receptor 7A17-like n=1 Tax=Odobenus rosmarus divergens TaxID=9708 RepID=A0A2U3WI40_ODORO|nr:PREDICTED: olfactory receptor 7A17-like [Odobenus rosmarus divergens]
MNPLGIFNLELEEIRFLHLDSYICWGTHASRLPAVLSGNRASVSIISHPAGDSDLHMETFLSETPFRHLHHVEPGNDSGISEFLLLGLSEKPELQPVIFGLFFSMYLITVFGNLLIILAVSSDSHLHTPMYFFLANLSFVDICFTSTTVPKMLWNIQAQSKVITYAGCLTQMYFFILFAGFDDFLLAVMAYDRFVAICHPLHYTVIMKPSYCVLLVLVVWVMSVLNSLLENLTVLLLSFCTEVEISHFFCEINQVVQLACSDIFLNDMVMYFATVLLGGGPLAGILFSYSKIVSSICGISSAQGKYKAFSTCASHLSVVSLFYCTGLGVYLSSAAPQSSHSSAVASVMYTVVTPMLNPFIYSLRNRDIKRALKRIVGVPVM